MHIYFLAMFRRRLGWLTGRLLTMERVVGFITFDGSGRLLKAYNVLIY